MHAQKRQAFDGEKDERDDNAEGAGGNAGKDEENFAAVTKQCYGSLKT